MATELYRLNPGLNCNNLIDYSNSSPACCLVSPAPSPLAALSGPRTAPQPPRCLLLPRASLRSPRAAFYGRRRGLALPLSRPHPAADAAPPGLRAAPRRQTRRLWDPRAALHQLRRPWCSRPWPLKQPPLVQPPLDPEQPPLAPEAAAPGAAAPGPTTPPLDPVPPPAERRPCSPGERLLFSPLVSTCLVSALPRHLRACLPASQPASLPTCLPACLPHLLC
ncbi:unnamed protein product [Closterium sp. NIES-54]